MAKLPLSNNMRTSSWRSTSLTLLLGGTLGYLLAVLCLFGIHGTDRHDFLDSHFTGKRWLEEESFGNDSSEMNETGEAEVDAITMDSTVTIIVVILIVMTIAFESAKEYIEETASRNLRPIISSLFGELTILGFLSICTFCVTKLGVFRKLSVWLFGAEEEEALLEIFEFIHYMLFVVMVFFVATVIALMADAKKTEERWSIMNKACRDSVYMAKLDELEAASGTIQQNWLAYLLQSLVPCAQDKNKTFRKDLQLFRELRTEFILERELEPPFSPKEANGIGDDFDFGNYLGICLGHELAHVVHVKVVTWFLFALLTLLFCGINVALENQYSAFAWVWVATGFILFFVGNFFDYHVQDLLHQLGATSRMTQVNNEGGPLLPNIMPAWTQINLDTFHANRSWLGKCFGGKGAMSRQDALYWFGRNGPKLYMILFQVQLVFVAAYVALLLLTFYEHMCEYTSRTEALVFIVLSVFPIAFMMTKFQKSAARMSMACCLGVHRRPQVIEQVIRDEKIDRVIRALVVMFQLQHAAHGSGGPSPGHNANEGFVKGHANSAELADAAKTFDALDSSGDGRIENHEIKNVLRVLGVPASDDNLQAILRVLDRNGDGHIDKEEFLAYYATNVLSVDHSLHHLAHNLYCQFDQDGSGQITLSEFKKVLEAFNVGFSVNEVGQLVNELDEHNDGLVGEHEFYELLKKHAHLFKPFHIPPLE